MNELQRKAVGECVDYLTRKVGSAGLSYEDLQWVFRRVRELSGLKPRARQTPLPSRIEAGDLARFFRAAGVAPGREPGRESAWELFFRLLYGSALRVSELCRLRLEDISWERCELYIAGKGHAGKGKKYRWVPYPESLGGWMRSQAAGRVKYLFESRPGRAYSSRRVQLRMKEMAERAGLDPVKWHPHALRHTKITELLEGGMSISSVMLIVGHASPNTTQRYSHVATRPVFEQFQALSREECGAGGLRLAGV